MAFVNGMCNYYLNELKNKIVVRTFCVRNNHVMYLADVLSHIYLLDNRSSFYSLLTSRYCGTFKFGIQIFLLRADNVKKNSLEIEVISFILFNNIHQLVKS